MKILRKMKDKLETSGIDDHKEKVPDSCNL